MSHRYLLMAGALCGALGVILGAFGAHALQAAVPNWGLSLAEQTQRLETWQVAVRYQMYHSLALLVVGLLAARRPDRRLTLAALLLVLGMLIFCGCLYLLVLSGIKILGAIVPLGGLCLITGWVLLAWAAVARDRDGELGREGVREMGRHEA